MKESGKEKVLLHPPFNEDLIPKRRNKQNGRDGMVSATSVTSSTGVEPEVEEAVFMRALRGSRHKQR